MATGTAPLLPFPPAAWRAKTIAKRVPVILGLPQKSAKPYQQRLNDKRKFIASFQNCSTASIK
jgi:hypothetical protein